MSEIKLGVRFPRFFGWLFLAFAVVSVLVVALSYVGDPPEWSRFDRLMAGMHYGWVSFLMFIVADYEKKATA